ncbi:MAG: carbamoyltransferase HypF, partial [Deltaproteobacteria bacterium]
PFALCEGCQREYAQPEDRRFHAEANCCGDCGPRLTLRDAAWETVPGDPIAAALRLLRAGQIVAIKGLGGFHLACDARNAAAVATLRERKQREEKPFVVMVASVPSVGALAAPLAEEHALLSSPARPAILLRKHPACDAALPGVAPGLASLGVMLPCTPVQHLLFHEAAGRPEGLAWLDAPHELALVMTSANPGGEPLVIDDEEARARLAGIAACFLVHDREIVARCDDSVARVAPGGLQFVRRARGYTPQAIKLPRSGPSVLAVGGWYKNTVCVTRGDEAFVSQHIGDLDSAAARGFFEETVGHLLALLDAEPEIVAHDLHPDFHSTRFAASFAHEHGIPALGVQHHHAHIASVLAEHGVLEPVIALALDGVGLGTDGRAWGGELLRVGPAGCERIGHLASLALPGGDRAAREPWRMAAAALHRLGRGDEIAERFAAMPAAPTVALMLARGLNSPMTSSLGRVFDAAAGLLGVRHVMAFEGQAAMLLEGLAEAHGETTAIANGWRIEGGVLDLLGLFSALADEREPARGAALFHATLVAALADWALAVTPAGGTIVGAGGCLLNQILARGLRARLASENRRFLEARVLPPNDGGLALGQAWIAIQHLTES